VQTANASLQALNTLRLPSTAEWLVRPTTVDEARAAIMQARSTGRALTVLGGGSNVVLRARLPGVVIVPRILGVEVVRRQRDILVTAGAGVEWHHLVRFCLGQGIAGLENLALIPGSVGAAPIQNIGAYGLELHERLDSLTALSCRDASIVTMRAADCEFGYRDSMFKRRPDAYLIVAVTLRLPPSGDLRLGYADVADEIARLGVGATGVNVAEAVCRIRRRKLPDPRRVPNVGSFFKNPIVDADTLERLRAALPGVPTYADRSGTKVAAARLIDAAGWKGRRIGRAGVWSRQPLVLVNLGDATSGDVLRLADAIRDDVGNRYGIALELEPTLLGVDA
jgi:UDP-N-acetylmuramate dehydrogenase